MGMEFVWSSRSRTLEDEVSTLCFLELAGLFFQGSRSPCPLGSLKISLKGLLWWDLEEREKAGI